MYMTIPIPVDFIQWLWFALGMTFGRGFGKDLDHTVQQTEWFTALNDTWKYVVCRILDVTHHWWVGGLLIAYCGTTPELFWFGWGLLVDDLPDIPQRMLDVWQNLKNMYTNNSAPQLVTPIP